MRSTYEVSISPADNGILVAIGCKRLVFAYSDIDMFLDDLKTYLTNPAGEQLMTEKYFPDMFVPSQAGYPQDCEPAQEARVNSHIGRGL